MEGIHQPEMSKRARRFRPWENLRKMFRRKNSATVTAMDTKVSTPRRLSAVFGSMTASSRSRSTSEMMTTSNKTQPVLLSANASNSSRAVSGSSPRLSAGLSRSHDHGLDGDDHITSPDPYSLPVQQQHEPAMESLPSLQYMNELRLAIGVRSRQGALDDGEVARSPVLKRSIHNAAVGAAGGGGMAESSLVGVNNNSCEEVLHAAGRSTSSSLLMTGKLAASQPINEINRDGNGEEEESNGSAAVASAGVSPSSFPLNHSAARHKISIRPKKNHAPARHTRLHTMVTTETLEFDPSAGFEPLGKEENFERPEATPLAPERKNRTGRNSSVANKQRSLSLSRTIDQSQRENELSAGISEAPLSGAADHQRAIGTASSTGKLTRSKSSVEKKLHHEVAVFWRRTKQAGTSATRGLFNNKKTDNVNSHQQETVVGPVTTELVSEPAGGNKRKDLRKIKRDKEEKRSKEKSDANGNNSKADGESSSSPPAFLSRFFSSRRSARRNNNKKASITPPPVISTEPIKATEPKKAEQLWVRKEEVGNPPPLPKPRTVFLPHLTKPGNREANDTEEMEVDWTAPQQHSPYLFRSSHQRSSSTGPPSSHRNNAQQIPDRVGSPKLTRNREPSPLRHHRIHIAGLSPYQRRVARIGNGLEISDDEWDFEDNSGNNNSRISPGRSYHFKPDTRHHGSDNSLDMTAGNNVSLPVNINQDFILKKAPTPSSQPAQQLPPTLSATTDNIRRSLELLKFSNNEGLKKTIDSLNQPRMSRSSDQLAANIPSDDVINQRGGHQSGGSMSNSTSSLNISDLGGDEEMLEVMATTSSVASGLSSHHSMGDQKDVRDDVQEVHDQFRWNVNTLESPTKRCAAEPESPLATDVAPTDKPSTTPSPVLQSPSSPSSPKEASGSSWNPPSPSALQSDTPPSVIKISQRPWENRRQSPPMPMFSMSVRVQNPPDAVNTGIVKYKRSVSTPGEDRSASQSAIPPHRNSLPKPFIPPARAQQQEQEDERLPSSHQLAKLVTARPWQSKEEKERQNKVALIHQQDQPEVETVEVMPDVKLRTKNRSPVTSPHDASPPTGSGETSELYKVFARRSLKVDTSPEESDQVATNWTRSTSSGNGGSILAASRLPSEAPQSLPAEKMDPPKRKSPKPIPMTPPSRSPPASITVLPSEERGKMSDSPESANSPQPPTQTAGAFPFVRLPVDSNKNSADNITSRITSNNPNDSSSPEDIWKRLPKTNISRQRGISADRNKFLPASVTATNDEDKTVQPGPVRQSKVLDMVHNFQRLQVTS